MDDHQTMRLLLDRITNDPSYCEVVLPLLSLLVTAHERAEEDQVYPALRRAGAPDEVEHSQEEHLLVDQLLDEVTHLAQTGQDVGDALTKLADALTHHLEEEEESILEPIDQWLDPATQSELGKAFLESRQAHLGEHSEDITMDELQQQAQNLGMGTEAAEQDEAELKATLQEMADK